MFESQRIVALDKPDSVTPPPIWTNLSPDKFLQAGISSIQDHFTLGDNDSQ